MPSRTAFVAAILFAGSAEGFIQSAKLPVYSNARRSTASELSMAAEPLGVGVIGAGRIGDIHANTLAFRTPGAKLIAVADIFEEAGKRVTGRCGGKFYKDWKEMVNDPEVNAVVIGSPTPFHAEQIIECARLGKDVFCEKPISFDLATIDECMSHVEKAGIQLVMGFQRRFDENFRAVRRGIDAGDIGEVRTFHITSRDPAPPPADYLKKSGGIFLDMTSHDFDMARFLCGDGGGEVEEVFVVAKSFDPEAAEAGDFDTQTTTLKFTNGVFGTITNSRRCAYGYDQRVEVFGKGGSIDGLNRSPQSVLTSTGAGVKAPLPYSFFMDRYADSYVNILNAFVKCVASGDERVIADLRPALGADGKASVLIGMAAKKSALENRPVRIAEILMEHRASQATQGKAAAQASKVKVAA